MGAGLNLARHVAGVVKSSSAHLCIGADVEVRLGCDGLRYVLDTHRVCPPESARVASHLPPCGKIISGLLTRMLRPGGGYVCELVCVLSYHAHARSRMCVCVLSPCGSSDLVQSCKRPLNSDVFTSFCMHEDRSVLASHVADVDAATLMLTVRVRAFVSWQGLLTFVPSCDGVMVWRVVR